MTTCRNPCIASVAFYDVMLCEQLDVRLRMAVRERPGDRFGSLDRPPHTRRIRRWSARYYSSL